MNSITFISTVHDEMGECSSDELCKILEVINPEVIFIEALEETYSEYQKNTFFNFGVFHKKLEIRAIQKYSLKYQFEYVPVLEKGLSTSFDQKFNSISHNTQFQTMLDNYNSLAGIKGFDFLNSEESINQQEEMRNFGDIIFANKDLIQAFNDDLDKYENSMINNIDLYCKNNKFKKAVFMCGVGHRQSIINKIDTYKSNTKSDYSWEIYGYKWNY